MNAPERRTGSLGRRLMLIMALSMAAALVILVWSVLREVDHEAEEVLDAWQLIIATDLLRDVMHLVRQQRLNEAWLAIETTRGLENSWLSRFSNTPALLFLGEKGENEGQGKDDRPKAYIWLARRDGKVLLGKSMPEVSLKWSGKGHQVHTLIRDDHEWRVVSLADDTGRYCIFVAQRDDLRNYLARETGNHMFKTQLVIIPMVMMALWFGVQRGLRPLSRLRHQITSRKPGNLEPLPLKEVPAEVLPVVEAVNDLLARLRQALEAERAFTANAAHELRNPLAAVRNLGRVVSEGRDPEEVRRCGAMLEQSMERMSGLISQLLHLARLDAGSAGGADDDRECDLRELVEESVSGVFTRAVERNIEIRYRSDLEATLRCDPKLMVILFTNLLSNAVKYGRPEGLVEVQVKIARNLLLVQFLDDGSGVKPRQLPRLFDRFYRTAAARQQSEGTGLGLAIVQRIAELYDLTVSAENRIGGGLRVTVAFPPFRWKKVS